MTSRQEAVRRLEKRLAFLERRIADRAGKDALGSYDVAEANALRVAIKDVRDRMEAEAAH